MTVFAEFSLVEALEGLLYKSLLLYIVNHTGSQLTANLRSGPGWLCMKSHSGSLGFQLSAKQIPL